MLKMNFIFKIFIIFLSISLNAQQRRSADYYAQIPEKIENEQEIRIYKGNGITNSGRIFRIFKENKTWKAELIQWFFDKQISLDEFQSVKPMVTKLKASRNFYEIFLNIEARNIGFLPKEESFKYKKEKQEVLFDEEEKDYVIQIISMSVLDGVDYLVKYKSGKRYHEFHYNNPQSYLESTPNIDEYKSLLEILKYIESEFKIKF